jgi:transposase
MPSAYPYELRTRVIAALESGMEINQITSLFKISRDTLYKWKGIKKASGDVLARGGYQKGHSHKLVKFSGFEEFVAEHNGKSLKELARLSGGRLSGTTIWRGLKAIGYSYKKNFLSSQEGRWIKEGV